MDKDQMVLCFNEWMRRVIADPQQFQIEFQAVNIYLAEASGGKVPSYGKTCTAYMEKLAKELAAKSAA